MRKPTELEQLMEYGIYPTRYRADKVRKTYAWNPENIKIVKVGGGYRLMTISEYDMWKNQK